MQFVHLGALLLLCSGGDHNVQWNGVSHVAWQDRRPLCPVDGEAFTIYFQAYRLDLTEARVHVDDGGSHWIDADYDHDRGPYAVWRAEIPNTIAESLRYYIELTDGEDTDYYSAAGMTDDPPADGGFVIDYSTLGHAPLGATPLPAGGTVFRVWAPHPQQAWVRGTFNNWSQSNPMTRVGEDFVARVPAAGDLSQYKYYFEPGGLWKPDPRGRRYNPASGNYDTYVIDSLRYAWGDAAFQTPTLDDLVIYELHVGTFAGRNDPLGSGSIPATYADVAAHVDHFVELGVNAVELMPTCEFPGDFSAGYNPITAWTPESRYGPPDALKRMVDTLHQNGIAVLSDIVWNHVSPTDNFLWNFDSPSQQLYFRVPDVQTPWGSQADFGRGGVRAFYRDSALHWLEEFHLDGYRMDATDFMNIFPQEAAGWSLMQSFNDAIDNRFAGKLAIAEQLPNDEWVTRPTASGGAGFDSQWHDAFKNAVRGAVLAAAFGDPNMSAIRGALNGGGVFLSGPRVTNYFEGHDEVYTSSGGSRIVRVIDTTPPHDDMWAKGRAKLAQGLVMLAPGVPMIYQGSEWLDPTNFEGARPDGGDRIDWSLKATNAAIFRYFKDLIAIRRGHASFRASAGSQVFHVDEANNVLAFQRWDRSNGVFVVVASFNNSDLTNYRIGLPQAGDWTEALNSQSSVYDGNGVDNGGSLSSEAVAWDGYAQSAAITIPQMGLLVFRWNATSPCPPDVNGDRTVDLADLATLLVHFGESAAGHSDGDVDGDSDVDLSDLAALLAAFGSACR